MDIWFRNDQQETFMPISESIFMACDVTYQLSLFFPFWLTIWLAIKPRFIKAITEPLISCGPKAIPLFCLSQACINVFIINGVNGRCIVFLKCFLGKESK